MNGFGPDLAALVVFRKMGIALMRLASGLLLKQFRHHPVQQDAPCDTDVPVHHLAHLVMAEIVEPTFGLLAQQPAPHQRIEGMQKTFFWSPRQRQQRLKVETAAQHRCQIEQWAVRGRHARQTYPHGITHRVWKRQVEGVTNVTLGFAQRMQDRPEEKRISVTLAVQAASQPGHTQPRFIHPLQQRFGIARSEPCQRHVAGVGFTPQALDQTVEMLVVVEFLVPVSAGQKHRPARDLACQEVHEPQARIIGPLDVVHHHDQPPVLRDRIEELDQRVEHARLPRLRKVG